MKSKFLTAQWRNLIMANYEVDPVILQKYVPYGTELDLWDGVAYVSLVGFMFLDTKVLGIPVPFHRNFEEVNLRFYVRYKHEEEWRRGVVFIKEIVPKAAITFVANTLYGEHYHTMPMRHSTKENGEHLFVQYEWFYQKKWHSIDVTCHPDPQPIAEGSEAEFITEHYWGYTKLSPTKTSQYQVEHPKWDMYNVESCKINCDFEAIYGKDFVALNETPKSVFMAKGSEIIVRMGGKIQQRKSK